MEPPEAGARWLGHLRELSREDIEDAVQEAHIADLLLERKLDLDALVEAGTARARARIDELGDESHEADSRRSRTYRYKIGVNAARQVSRRRFRDQANTQPYIGEDGLPSPQVEMVGGRDGGAEAAVDLKDIGRAFDLAVAALGEVDRAMVDCFREADHPGPGDMGCWTSVAIALKARGLQNNRGEPWARDALRKRFQRLPAIIRDWLHAFV